MSIQVKPPKRAQAIARRALKRRAELAPSRRGGLSRAEAAKQGITSGVAQAEAIAKGKALDAKQVHRFFSRFRGTYLKAVTDGKPWDKSKVQQAWDLWGGTPMWEAAKKAIEKTEGKTKKKPKLPLGFRFD